ncbi:MAG TPA: methionyl-tRNA formyltransferase [Promineifilum sp.]|nr:methionyl-tRNA formyltransferase [Promineifilum sp.]HRO91529.1 methionyl-tRNA formyltransferase [Promineifilum sp.]HRQ13271.1 methionyl-tRNA formyltransferase [Promineifilum sp.]
MIAVARIIFMGTPEFAVPCLTTLIETQTVVGVVTQPDKPAGRGNRLRPSPVKVAAEAAGIPVYQPKSLRKEEAAAPLREWQPDLIVVAAFGQILRPHVLYLSPRGSLNVHASLLPRWRGASPIQHAILAGDETTGVTLMKMDEGLDTGAMYVQESLSIDPRETAATLHDRLAALGAAMLRRHLDDILDGRLSPTPQGDAGFTYAPMIRKEAGEIDWQRDAGSLDRHIRAMTPWPGAFTWWGGEPLKVLGARPLDFSPSGVPGQVVFTPEGIIVVAGSGGLLLDTIQAPGKRAMAAEEFVRGHPELAGAVLGPNPAAGLDE